MEPPTLAARRESATSAVPERISATVISSSRRSSGPAFSLKLSRMVMMSRLRSSDFSMVEDSIGRSASILRRRSLIRLLTLRDSLTYISTDAPSAISANSLDTKNRGMANSATKPDFTIQFAIYCSGVIGISAVRRSASSCSRLYSLIFSLPARVPAISFSQSSIGLVFLFCLFPRLCVDLETAKDGTRSRSDRISPSPREATVATRMGMIIGCHLTFCIQWASCIGT